VFDFFFLTPHPLCSKNRMLRDLFIFLRRQEKAVLVLDDLDVLYLDG
jgi:predicted phosphatase